MIPADAVEAALQRYEGTVNSFVRGAGATMTHVVAQYRAALRSGATDEALSERTISGVSNPPNADPQRVTEIKVCFLNSD